MDVKTPAMPSTDPIATAKSHHFPGDDGLAYDSELAALMALAMALEAHKTSPANYLSTSLIFFALAMPAYAPQVDALLGSSDASAFSASIKALAGHRFEDAWNRYFRVSIDKLNLSATAGNRALSFTDNCRDWITAAGRQAKKMQRRNVTIADLLQAMREQPLGRFRDILDSIYVDMTDLYPEYERRILGVEIPPLEDKNIFQHFIHDRADRFDFMQFSQYATAIASFLTSPSTSGPISISIQAPWGAGKSSLMHQVRHLLDPLHAETPAGQPLLAGGVLQLLDRLAKVPSRPHLPVTENVHSQQERRWTIWFNAWKYESSEQVWAGLVDAIITQVSARLPLAEREMFLLRLNLARIDDGKVRQKLVDRAAGYWWAGARWIILTALFAPGALALASVGAYAIAGWTSSGVAAALAGWLAWSRKKVKSEPATFSLAEYVRVPDYGKSVGVVHQIHQDLLRIVALLPVRIDQNGNHLGTAPLVIFIDDLDRCAPNKVASIVEGINSFLAGDQQEFMFVIGMDPQLVAAALEHAHKDVKHYLPAYEQNAPLGWRFMDKFIQLAFTIPPRRTLAIQSFVRSLTQERIESLDSDGAAKPEVAIVASEPQDATRQDAIQAERAAQEIQRLASRKITNESEDVQAVTRGITAEFMFSPRDIKRILNFVRFVLLLRIGRVARGDRVPPRESYQRWIALCIRWPDLARWLQWAPGLMQPDMSIAGIDDLSAQRLHMLETAAGDHADLASWTTAAAERIGLPVSGVAWLSDAELHSFFAKEARRAPEQRLSHAAAIGFY